MTLYPLPHGMHGDCPIKYQVMPNGWYFDIPCLSVLNASARFLKEARPAPSTYQKDVQDIERVCSVTKHWRIWYFNDGSVSAQDRATHLFLPVPLEIFPRDVTADRPVKAAAWRDLVPSHAIAKACDVFKTALQPFSPRLEPTGDFDSDRLLWWLPQKRLTKQTFAALIEHELFAGAVLCGPKTVGGKTLVVSIKPSRLLPNGGIEPAQFNTNHKKYKPFEKWLNARYATHPGTARVAWTAQRGQDGLLRPQIVHGSDEAYSTCFPTLSAHQILEWQAQHAILCKL